MTEEDFAEARRNLEVLSMEISVRTDNMMAWVTQAREDDLDPAEIDTKLLRELRELTPMMTMQRQAILILVDDPEAAEVAEQTLGYAILKIAELEMEVGS